MMLNLLVLLLLFVLFVLAVVGPTLLIATLLLLLWRQEKAPAETG